MTSEQRHRNKHSADSELRKQSNSSRAAVTVSSPLTSILSFTCLTALSSCIYLSLPSWESERRSARKRKALCPFSYKGRQKLKDLDKKTGTGCSVHMLQRPARTFGRRDAHTYICHCVSQLQQAAFLFQRDSVLSSTRIQTLSAKEVSNPRAIMCV